MALQDRYDDPGSNTHMQTQAIAPDVCDDPRVRHILSVWQTAADAAGGRPEWTRIDPTLLLSTAGMTAIIDLQGPPEHWTFILQGPQFPSSAGNLTGKPVSASIDDAVRRVMFDCYGQVKQTGAALLISMRGLYRGISSDALRLFLPFGQHQVTHVGDIVLINSASLPFPTARFPSRAARAVDQAGSAGP